VQLVRWAVFALFAGDQALRMNAIAKRVRAHGTLRGATGPAGPGECSARAA
jgi:hypothetical protein